MKKIYEMRLTDYCNVTWTLHDVFTAMTWHKERLFVRNNDNAALRQFVSSFNKKNAAYYDEIGGCCTTFDNGDVFINLLYDSDETARIYLAAHEYAHATVSRRMIERRNDITTEEEEAAADIVALGCLNMAGVDSDCKGILDLAQHFGGFARLTNKAILLARDIAEIMKVYIDIDNFAMTIIWNCLYGAEMLDEQIENGSLTNLAVVERVNEYKGEE